MKRLADVVRRARGSAVDGNPGETRDEPPPELAALRTAIEQDTKSRGKWTVGLLAILAGSLIVTRVALIAAPATKDPMLRWDRGVRCIVFVCFAYLSAWGLSSIVRRDRAEKHIDHLSDPQAIGTLIDLLADGGRSRGTRRRARKALIRLLPLLKTADSESLGKRQRAWLRSVIANGGYIGFGYYEDPEVAVAILRAVPQMLDSRFLPMVERATRAKQRDVREAAQLCLPAVLTLVQEQKLRNTLVRPSSSSDLPGAETLLRPIGAKTDTEPRQLLRAGDGSEVGKEGTPVAPAGWPPG